MRLMLALLIAACSPVESGTAPDDAAPVADATAAIADVATPAPIPKDVPAVEPDPDPGPCVPDCDGRECGNDGCKGKCGTCPASVPFCTPEGLCGIDYCKERECGIAEDGSTCGACPAAAPYCKSDPRWDCGGSVPCAECRPEKCTPYSCGDGAGGECGSDGCGGTCGTCGGYKTCRPKGGTYRCLDVCPDGYQFEQWCRGGKRVKCKPDGIVTTAFACPDEQACDYVVPCPGAPESCTCSQQNGCTCVPK